MKSPPAATWADLLAPAPAAQNHQMPQAAVIKQDYNEFTTCLFTHAYQPPRFFIYSPHADVCAHEEGTQKEKASFFFWPLFVSSLYIRAFCLQLIIGVELNPNGRQREKLNQKKNKITGAVIPTEQARWDRREMNPSWAAIPGFLFT